MNTVETRVPMEPPVEEVAIDIQAENAVVCSDVEPTLFTDGQPVSQQGRGYEYDHARVAQMVTDIQNGSDASWNELVSTFSEMILLTAARCGVRNGSVEDVMQNTFIKLYRFIDRIEHPERLAGWLQTVAIRESNRIRYRDSSQYHIRALHDVALNPKEAHYDPDIADELLINTRRLFIRAHAPELTEKQQDMFWLLMDERLKYKDIVAILGIPIGSVGARRRAIINNLKRLVTSDLFDEDYRHETLGPEQLSV